MHHVRGATIPKEVKPHYTATGHHEVHKKSHKPVKPLVDVKKLALLAIILVKLFWMYLLFARKFYHKHFSFLHFKSFRFKKIKVKKKRKGMIYRKSIRGYIYPIATNCYLVVDGDTYKKFFDDGAANVDSPAFWLPRINSNRAYIVEANFIYPKKTPKVKKSSLDTWMALIDGVYKARVLPDLYLNINQQRYYEETSKAKRTFSTREWLWFLELFPDGWYFTKK